MVRILTLAAVLAAAAPAAAEDHPIVTAVSKQLKDPAKPFTMLVAVKVKEGKAEAFEAAFKDAIAGTRKEKGNLAYQLNKHTKGGGLYVVYERWKDLDALKAHVEAEHIKKLLGSIHDLIEGAPDIEVLTPVGE